MAARSTNDSFRSTCATNEHVHLYLSMGVVLAILSIHSRGRNRCTWLGGPSDRELFALLTSSTSEFTFSLGMQQRTEGGDFHAVVGLNCGHINQ